MLNVLMETNRAELKNNRIGGHLHEKDLRDIMHLALKEREKAHSRWRDQHVQRP